jgi:DNA mismatch endonuclease, patch repair protein
MDTLTPAARSRVMSRIRSKDTKPELVVRCLAHRSGYRFRLHRRDLPGAPDLVFPKWRKVIFVHGCFWHMHPRCAMSRMPSSRREYWVPKLVHNRARDLKNIRRLRRAGWKVDVVWECETRQPGRVERKLRSFLGRRPAR